MNCGTILVVIDIGMMCLLLGYCTLGHQLLPLLDAADAHEIVLVLVRDHDLLVRIVQHRLPYTSLTWATSVDRLVWIWVIGPERLLLQGIWNTTDNARLLKWILREML